MLTLLYPGTGFFMHASTASGQEGDTARLESREMTPSRKCSVQCLQFYYYHSGNESDQLNVWMRVYRDERNPNGTLHHMGQITGWDDEKVNQPLGKCTPRNNCLISSGSL